MRLTPIIPPIGTHGDDATSFLSWASKFCADRAYEFVEFNGKRCRVLRPFAVMNVLALNRTSDDFVQQLAALSTSLTSATAEIKHTFNLERKVLGLLELEGSRLGLVGLWMPEAEVDGKNGVLTPVSCVDKFPSAAEHRVTELHAQRTAPDLAGASPQRNVTVNRHGDPMVKEHSGNEGMDPTILPFRRQECT